VSGAVDWVGEQAEEVAHGVEKFHALVDEYHGNLVDATGNVVDIAGCVLVGATGHVFRSVNPVVGIIDDIFIRRRRTCWSSSLIDTDSSIDLKCSGGGTVCLPGTTCESCCYGSYCPNCPNCPAQCLVHADDCKCRHQSGPPRRRTNPACPGLHGCGHRRRPEVPAPSPPRRRQPTPAPPCVGAGCRDCVGPRCA
jgi:hypothetical protein